VSVIDFEDYRKGKVKFVTTRYWFTDESVGPLAGKEVVLITNPIDGIGIYMSNDDARKLAKALTEAADQ